MKDQSILLDHGSGGKLSNELINSILMPAFDNAILEAQEDGAIIPVNQGRLAFSTDTFVVDPIFFPGGNIGDLAVHGTVNDVAMCGGVPQYLSVGLIIEEGFEISQLKIIVASMAKAAAAAGVRIVTGDTKVVPKGACDKIFINTSGFGFIPDEINLSASLAKPGDRIILSGNMADHGVTILTQRESLEFDAPIQSDSAALNTMTAAMLKAAPGIHVLRDPTRGGVGTTLCEIAKKSNIGMKIREKDLPVDQSVMGVCDLLGLDPLYVANEGKLLAIVPPEQAEAALEACKQDVHGKKARFIGEVVADHPGQVVMQTAIGGARMVDMLTGEQLPRIC
ncbi:hydrogenase expression/formation protein HypE [Desulfatibacillum aliphaticivorans]|uniref:hydrogenase expression/formation protein HypE n=1 Tax=Desulfatibacillum aliphaticivorans TaxID=218208 RepID=UPI00041B1DDB|nr:hydrogenase expression/formation protein HypE [Desulfatibacillum aliphaticivorans]